VRLPALVPVLVLGAAAVLCCSVSTCVDHDSGAFDVATSCGPAGVLTLSYAGAERGCAGDCFGYLEAPGANALGLPDRGEADGLVRGARAPDGAGAVLSRSHLALVGRTAIPGAIPALVVERRCRASHRNDDSGTLDLACDGDVPEAACSGTLTLRTGGP
jgi:hypothetical protein